MCGLLDLIGTPWQASGPAALSALASRGPDDAGVIEEGGVFLGHQPMKSDDGRLAIVFFNGEIYNFRALRRELEAAGQRFLTSSDTEVILAGYRVWGQGLVKRLDGMFAFVLWDAPARWFGFDATLPR